MQANELIALQSLPLDIKILKTKQRIREWIEYHGEDKVYISFSGGKDSTVLLDIVRQINSNIVAVFSDTGLEFPELREFVKNTENIHIIKPTMPFTEVLTKYGYPIVSKDTSFKLYKLRENNLSEKYRNYILHGDERGNYGKLPDKWHYLIDADFKISSTCCDVMKKRVFHKFEKETGKNAPFTGELASESRLRKQQYLKFGCNAFERKKGFKSTPIGFWTENDILEYIRINDLKIPSVYGDIVECGTEKKGMTEQPKYCTTCENRTGCVFCLYGIHLEKGENRIQRLKKTHPKIYDYCIRGGKYNEDGLWIPHNGLGMGHVLDVLGIEY